MKTAAMTFDISKQSNDDLKLLRKQMMWMHQKAETSARKTQINRLLRRIGHELNERYNTNKYHWE